MILQVGRNCWRRERAGRVAFLVDADDYFSAFSAAASRAERSILLVGWDVHSRVSLGRREDGSERTLYAFLEDLVRRRPRLRVDILSWDFAMIYALDRESRPIAHFGNDRHRRIRFRLDGRHPIGASHHQKIVVIDDAVAFAGGMDLAPYRWDTRAHRIEDPGRVTPSGAVYGPIHDVQMMVDGDAAAALGALVRQRWRRATRRRLRTPKVLGDPWPESVSPDLRDVTVAIARTDPGWKRRWPEVREVESLWVDAIRAARKWIYIENQYLTSRVVGEALEQRLKEPDGPEIIVVLPCRCSGWLEEATMGVLRHRLVSRLRAEDPHGRLRVFFPVARRDPVVPINVHSKVLLVDDELVRIGSSNLNNRSMGLDTECDLAIEADGDPAVAEKIRDLRHDLLAEHLGVPVERFAAEESRGSLVGAVEALRDGERTLLPLDTAAEATMASLLPDTAFLDPERIVDPREILDEIVPAHPTSVARRPLLRLGLVVAILVGLAAAWRLGPLAEIATPENLARWIEPVRDGPLGAVIAMAAFVVGGLLVVPVTLLIAATAVAFGPWLGFVYALVGCLASATVTYWIGRSLWRDAVRRIAGPKLDRLSRRLAERGTMAMALLRVVPVAPFSVVNVVAGSSRVSYRDYLLGTLFGMTPGVLAMTLLADRLLSAVEAPSATNLALLATTAAALLAAAAWAQRKLAE